jgi:hypothetical protein
MTTDDDPESTQSSFAAESALLEHLAESQADYVAGRGLTLEELAAELDVDLKKACTPNS